MQQSALTIVVPIDPQRLEAPASWPASRARLVQLSVELEAARGPAVTGSGSAIERELRALLAEPGVRDGGVHYLSFFAIDADAGLPAYLVLEITCDGSAAAQRARLAALAPEFLLALFRDSPELAAGARALPAFLRRHALSAGAFYVAFPGSGVRQIQAEQRLRQELRSRFESTGVPAPSGACPRAGQAGSVRLSPTSASALWRALQGAFGEHGLVREARRPPLSVRWSLSSGGVRDRLQRWGKWLGPALLAAAAAEGLCWRDRGPAFAALRSSALGLALALAVAWLVLIAGVTLRESPRSLRWRGRWLVLRGMFRESAGAMLGLAGALGLALLGGAVAYRLSAAQGIVSALVLGGLLLGLTRAGFGWLAAAVGAGTLLLAALLPTEHLVLLPAGLLALLCAALIGLLGAFLYVMVGRALAWVWPLLCVAAALAHLGWHTRTRALAAGDLLELSALGAAALSGALGLAALWLGAWLVAVRRLEHRDTEREAAAHQLEDGHFQNHLVSVSRLEPGALRLRTLRRVLRAVQLSARVYARRGDRGGIPTLHFARLLVLPDRQRLLFIAHHDGDLASCLHDFSATTALTAVWRYCVGRKDQVPTLGWYAAYPELSVRDIAAAARVRDDLARPIDDPASWRGRLRARFGSPLREADCDQTLRAL